VFALNDTIRVRVAAVNLDDRKIDFVLPKDEGASAQGVKTTPVVESGTEDQKSEQARKKRRRRKKPTDRVSAENKGGGSDEETGQAAVATEVNAPVEVGSAEADDRPRKPRRRRKQPVAEVAQGEVESNS